MKTSVFSCYICGDTNTKHIAYKSNNICILRCSRCQMLFRTEGERYRIISSNNTSEYYAESIRYQQGNQLFFRLVFEDLIRNFPQIKNGNVLDFGCGIGNSLIEAKKLGFNVFGVDSSKYAAYSCKKLGFEILTSLDMLTNQCVKFNLISLNHVIDHIASPLDLLNKLKELLKDDGILRIEVPNCSKFSLWKSFSGCKYIVMNPNPEHVYYFTIDTLKNIFLKTGFKVIDIHAEGFGDPIRHKATMINPSIAIRILSNLRPLKNPITVIASPVGAKQSSSGIASSLRSPQ